MTTSAVTANQTVTVSASYTSGGVTKAATKSVSIIDVPLVKTLSGLTITGPSSVNESSSGTYTAMASWSDGSTSTVTPVWSENSTYATISTGGVLTTSAVTADQTVTVSASYTSGGVTKTATKAVSIIDVPLVKTLSGLTINGPNSVNESSSGTYAATASWSDGSTSTVTPAWSENSTYSTISPGGLLTTSAVTADQTVTVSASYTSGGVTKTATKAVSITKAPVLPSAEVLPGSVIFLKAESGVIKEPMQVVSSPNSPVGSYITTTTKYVGTAVYNFNITEPGTYEIVGTVYGTDRLDDSFFVKIDNGVDDAWDLNPTEDPALFNVWMQDKVTARGTGTTNAPQFDPLAVQLEAGPHTITFRGRELNARLAYFYILKVPSGTDRIEAESGVLTAPMQIVSSAEASGGAYIETATKYIGTAVYNFNITEPGTYEIVGNVYGTDKLNDSFFVKIDNGVDDAWDMNPTEDPALFNVWRQDAVTARGTGTTNAPEFDPLVVDLGAGPHTITFRGRELNSRLDYFYLQKFSGGTSIKKLEMTNY